jgi:predicted amidohydrolase YtcJ
MHVSRYVFAGLIIAWLVPLQGGEPDWLLLDGKIYTADQQNTVVEAIAITGASVTAVGSTRELRRTRGAATKVVDLGGRAVVPGLIDTHNHAIRAGLTYSKELNWAEEDSLAAALQRVRQAADQRPAGEWITVVGGWHFAQFAERRMPAPAELEEAAGAHPLYVQHQYDTAIVNPAGFAALGLDQPGQVPQGLTVERDPAGQPTGILQGSVRAFAQLYGRLPKPSEAEQQAGTVALLLDLNRYGLTGLVDSGGGGMFWPEDYQALFALWRQGRLSLRVRFRMLPQPPHAGRELATLQAWTAGLASEQFDHMLNFAGLGEAFTWGMHDGDSIGLEFHPDQDSKRVFRQIADWAAASGYATEIHASSDSSARQILDIYEQVNRQRAIGGLRWTLCHIDDATPETLQRMRALGMNYSVQDRLFYAGDKIVERVGAERASAFPPLQTAWRSGINVAGGTDAHRVAPFNPMRVLQWMVDGRSVSGLAVRSQGELLTREQALRALTVNAAWVTGEERERGSLEPGKLADLAVLDQDVMTVPVGRMNATRSLLTMVGGQVVSADGAYAELQP